MMQPKRARTDGAIVPMAAAPGGANRGGAPPPGEGWTCGKCGNHNYENRTVCNMRSCGTHRDFVPGPSSAYVGSGKGAAVMANEAMGEAHRGGAPAPGEGWTCDKCGNQNYDNRMYCNKRSCGAPGPWTCPLCQNKNFANRMSCNMKRCGAARPPPPPNVGPLAAGLGMPAMGPQNRGAPASQVAQAIALLQAAGVANVPGVAEGIQKIVASGVVAAAAIPNFAHQPNRGNPNTEVQEGSWVCVECGNINFPQRSTCNGRSCGKPRSEVDGGPPTPGADSKTRLKPGSWVCGACQNINWPDRETCGMRKCQMPRDQVDAGPPMGM